MADAPDYQRQRGVPDATEPYATEVCEWIAQGKTLRSYCRQDGKPSRETIDRLWTELKTESARQDRSIFQTSSLMAVSAARGFPDGVRWFSASARAGATRTGQIVAAALLEHYRQTLTDMRQVGYGAYAAQQLRPYLRACVDQFSPKRRTLTQRVFERIQQRRVRR